VLPRQGNGGARTRVNAFTIIDTPTARPTTNSFVPNCVFITRWSQFLKNTFCYQRFWLVERVKWGENVRDVNNNNSVASTSALPFPDFTFYCFKFKIVLHQKSQMETSVNIRNKCHSWGQYQCMNTACYTSILRPLIPVIVSQMCYGALLHSVVWHFIWTMPCVVSRSATCPCWWCSGVRWWITTSRTPPLPRAPTTPPSSAATSRNKFSLKGKRGNCNTSTIKSAYKESD